MSTIQIFVLKSQNLIKVVYSQGNSPQQTLEEYPDCYLIAKYGQVSVMKNNQGLENDLSLPLLTIPVSRTIIKYVD